MKRKDGLVKGHFPAISAELWKNERYLEKQAEQGLFLKDRWEDNLLFERGTPRKMKYRIDIHSGLLDEETKAWYAEAGWDWVMWFNDYQIFSAPAERETTELHTDPAELEVLMRKSLKKEQWRAMRNMAFYAVAFAVFLLSLIVYLQRGVFLALADGTVVNICTTIVVVGCIGNCRGMWGHWKKYQEIQNRLREGIFPTAEEKEEAVEQKEGSFLRKAVSVAVFVLLAGEMVSSCSEQHISMETDFSAYPVVTAAEVTDLTGYTQSDLSFCNVGGRGLAKGKVKMRDIWETEAGEECVFYSVYYEAFSAGFAKGIAGDLCDFANGYYKKGLAATAEQRQDSRFDGLFLTETDFHTATAYLGERVLQISWNGATEKEAVLAKMAAILGNETEQNWSGIGEKKEGGSRGILIEVTEVEENGDT